MTSQKPLNICSYCGKEYVRNVVYQRHIIICEIIQKPKSQQISELQKYSDVPSLKKMYDIILELAYKCNQQEKKIEELEKIVKRPEKKFNALKWLENSQKPEQTFQDWIKTLKVTQEDIQTLINESVVQTIKTILEKNIEKKEARKYPIQCFMNNKQLYFIYDSRGDAPPEWQKMDIEIFGKIVKELQIKILHELMNWKMENVDKMSENDSLSINYNKTLIKLMNLNLNYDSAEMGKIRSQFHSYLQILQEI